MEIGEYEELKSKERELMDHLKGIREKITEFEEKVFSEMSTGDKKLQGTHVFVVSNLRRFVPQKGFQLKLSEFCNKHGLILTDFAIEKREWKPKSMSDVGKMMDNMNMGQHRQELMEILGFKEYRQEKVNITPLTE